MDERKVNFDDFADAVQKSGLNDDETRSTTHTSAITVTDWEAVQATLDDDND